MLSIIKIRFQKLKHEYYIYLIMTALAFAFTFFMGIGIDSDYAPTVLIVDNDKSEYSEMLVDELNKNNAFRYKNAFYEDAVENVENNKVSAAIIIGDDFEEKIMSNAVPTIELMKINYDTSIYSLESIVSGITSKLIGNVNISNIVARHISEHSNSSEKVIFEKAYKNSIENWKYRKPISVITETLNTSNGYNNTTHLMFGFTLFFSMFTITFSVSEILNDRESNTWQRLLISPLSKLSILGGNLISTYIIGIVQVGIIITGGKYLFGIDYGSNLLAIYSIVFAFVFTVTSLGLFLSGIVKTHAQLSAVIPVVLTSTSMLGGCMWPLEIVTSKPLLTLANLTPQKWALQGLEQIAMYGAETTAVIAPVIVLTAMGVIFFIIGVRLVRFE